MPSAQPFLHEDFLLNSEWSRLLYHEHAKPQPIFDYHCHLPPDQIAANRQFANLTQIWLAGDHYKWRALRTNGVSEDLITEAAPLTTKSFWRTRARSPTWSEIRCTIGRTWSCVAISGSTC